VLYAVTILVISMASWSSNQPQRRRGTRVRAQIPVRITGVDPATTFSETCHTLVVNPQGCGIRSSRPLEAGLQVRLQDLPGGGSALATVASALPLSNGSRYWLIGIALESPGNFWYLAPAPPDWGSYSAPPKFFPASVRYLSDDLFTTEPGVRKA
jgi:hypothetical protein